MSIISKFYEDSFPKSKGIVEWWGGYPKEEVGENEYKYYGSDNPDNENFNSEIAEMLEYKDMTYKLNKQGYRSDSFEDYKDSDKTKFLFLGCSVAFGQGIPENMMYSKVVANHFDAVHWNLSRVGNNIEGCLLALNNFVQAGYKADKVIIQYPFWERQVYVGDDEFIEYHSDIVNDKHRNWLISSNPQMNAWNWWVCVNAIKGICLENNLDFVEIVIQHKYAQYLPNALNFRSHYDMMPAQMSDKLKLARDGVHPGKVPSEMFAKTLIEHLEGKKPADPVLDILQNPQF